MFTSRNDQLLALPRHGSADEAFELYLDWRQASSACESAYRHWAKVARSRYGALAFATYTAALDGEHHAAAQYEAACCRNQGGCRP
jgi:hypothetical protein